MSDISQDENPFDSNNNNNEKENANTDTNTSQAGVTGDVQSSSDSSHTLVVRPHPDIWNKWLQAIWVIPAATLLSAGVLPAGVPPAGVPPADFPPAGVLPVDSSPARDLSYKEICKAQCLTSTTPCIARLRVAKKTCKGCQFQHPSHYRGASVSRQTCWPPGSGN